MIQKIFAYIEKTNITLQSWLATFLVIVVIRAFLENFSGLRPEAAMTTNAQALTHFILYWAMITIALSLVLHFLTKKSVIEVSKVILFGFTLVFVAPIIGFLITGGEGVQMTYLMVDSVSEAFRNFLTLYGVSSTTGVTIGMRIEILIIALIAFTYARYSGGNIAKSLVTAGAVYTVIFVSGVLPSIISIEASYSWLASIKNTLFGANLLNPMFQFSEGIHAYEMSFDGVMSQALYLILIPLGLVLLLRWNSKKTIAILKNTRPERLLHYFAMISLGIFLAFYEGLNVFIFGSMLDVVTIVLLFSSFYFAWMYAVGVNDIVDYRSDVLTNTKRPLVTQAVTVEEMKSANLLFLMAALFGGYLAGHEVLFLVMIFISISHIYSCPPLHLKRFVIVNSFLVSLASLSAVMAGFYTFSRNPSVDSFPISWVILIVVILTLFANIKDIKDIEGDKKFGVHTIPVIFGDKIGKLLIWVMVVAGLICITLVSGQNAFWYPSILGGIASWFAIHKTPYQDKYLFMLYFLYLLSLGTIHFLL